MGLKIEVSKARGLRCV